MVAIYGLTLLFRRQDMPRDLRDVHRLMSGCYLLLLIVDVLNGGGWSNLTATGVNYLPLVALAPFAYALRSLRLTPATLDRAMEAAVALALCISLWRLFLEESRPGGFNLNPIPYGFVIAVWAVFLFSRGLATGRVVSLVTAAAAFVPVFYTESKIALGCMVIGLLVVAFAWAWQHKRWLLFVAGFALSGSVVAAGAYIVVGSRIREALDDVAVLLGEGRVVEGSFGYRLELARAGWRAFLERPLLGHGQAQYMDAVRVHAPPGGIDISIFGHLHNDYIAHLASFGLFGIVFLIAYFATVVHLVTRSGEATYRRAGLALVAMLAVYMAAEIGFNMDPITSCLTLALGAVLSIPRAFVTPGDEIATKQH